MTELETKLNQIANEKDSKIIASNIKKDVTIFDVTGNVVELIGETRTVYPTTGSHTIKPSKGKTGITSVTINPVTAAIDSNIQAGNIKKNVSILGVTGTYEGGGPTPTGEIEITENGTYDVTSYASADVNVPATSDYNVKTKNPITEDTFSANIEEIKGINLSNNVSSLQGMFNAFISLKQISLFDTSNVTNMQTMFRSCSVLNQVPLFNTSNVTNMQSMFYYCKGLTQVPLFDTSNVTNMKTMFYLCGALKQVPLFNTSNVTNMQTMFQGCDALKQVPLFNTSKVTNMQNMFIGCGHLNNESLDNILQMCINAINFNSTKTLQYLGFNATNYPASRIQGLPHYQDFIDAGWTIGY